MRSPLATEYSRKELEQDGPVPLAIKTNTPLHSAGPPVCRPRSMSRAGCRLVVFALVLAGSLGLTAQTPDAALVKRALAAELKSAQDSTHPMRYRLRKSTPRLTSVKEIVETSDGAVARLISINDQPLSETDRQRDEDRLNGLLADPGRQRKRKQSQQDDTGRALKVLRALPKAFVFEYAGMAASEGGPVARFKFTPNPKFDPPDLETTVLTALTGEIWVDTTHERVVRLEGSLQQDVDFGWGILGRLKKGGWLRIEQENVGENQWRIVHFQMTMSGRVLIKTRVFDTREDESAFVRVPGNLTYRQAIQMLRSGEGPRDLGH